MKKLLPILSLLAFVHLRAQSGDVAVATPAPTQAEAPEPSAPEPNLELVSFEVRNQGEHEVEIRWATLSERKNEVFYLERSGDLRKWETLLEVEGEGAPEVHTGYLITDDMPLYGTAYYRVRVKEKNSMAELSDLASVYRSAPEKVIIVPDREPGRFRVQAKGELAEVRIMNSRGQFIPMHLEPIAGSVVVNAADLEPGTYFVQASVDGVPTLTPVTITPTGVVGG